jgi:hypothetical protein
MHFLAVSENEVPRRFHAINDLIDQLYSSWEMRLAEAPAVATESLVSCRVHVEKLVLAPTRPSPLSSQEMIELEKLPLLRKQYLRGNGDYAKASWSL